MERSRDAATARETQPGITRPSVIVVNIVEADGGSENSIFLEQFEIDEGTRRGVGVVGDRERVGHSGDATLGSDVSEDALESHDGVGLLGVASVGGEIFPSPLM
ncbi:hypothetical protein FF1_003531 [Malus domestica]